jgi:DNA-binding CsgD family transcriptional regulator
MALCVTCGSELHPERAEKYDYCTKRECRERNARPPTIVAVAVNKAADQYLVLDERTRGDLAAGRYQDQRKSASVADERVTLKEVRPPGSAARPARRPRTPRRAVAPWTKSQQDLALIYNARGMRPDEIAEKLGLSRYAVTQLILTAKNQGKL